MHSPHPNFSENTGVSGDDTSFLVREPCIILSSNILKSFEMLAIALRLLKSKLTVFNAYHRHSSSTVSVPV
jgi:hypothetical protein